MSHSTTMPAMLDVAIDLFAANTASNPENCGLLTGSSGEILSNLFLHKYLGGELYIQKARSRLEAIFDILNTPRILETGHSLASGLAGIGLMLTILTDLEFIDAETATSFEELKPILYEATINQMEEENNDLVFGAFGILYYLSFTTQSDEDIAEIEKIIDTVTRHLLKDHSGCHIPNSPAGAPGMKDVVNLSLAHGNCGFLIVLLRLFRLGYCRQKIHHIVTETINYIIRQRNLNRPDAVFSQYPIGINIHTGHFEYQNRMAWCYGDTNIALLLYTAGLLFNNSQYISLGDEIGFATCQRTGIADTEVSDSHFCHGSSGLASYYAYLHRLTGRPLYLHSYDFWIDKTHSFFSRDIEAGLYEKQNGLLAGLSGPLLTLMGHRFNDQQASWNRIFTFY